MTKEDAFAELVEQVRALFFALRGVTDALMADLDCTAPERSLLQELAGGAKTVPALARIRAISRQAMQKVVDQLIARGWVRAETNPEHQRSSIIALTTAGARILGAIRAREHALIVATKLPNAAAMQEAATTLAALTAAVEVAS